MVSFTRNILMLPEHHVTERSRGGKIEGLTGFGRAIDQRIKDLQVKEPQYTRDMVARLVGMSRQHLWRLLRGRAEISPVEVAQLARVLRLDPRELAVAYWEGQQPTPHPRPWSVEDVKLYYERLSRVAHDMDADEDDLRRLRNDTQHRAYGQLTKGSAMRVVEGGPLEYGLPQELKIRAQEFRLEALRAGADDPEITFIDSVLASPEAIFRQSGYSEPLTADEQRAELESVIEMLRAWLREHQRRRNAAAHDKATGG
jgi:transcriptional regulator with XRE-family HTH domain